MLGSSLELTRIVADSVYVKNMHVKNSFTDAENDNSWGKRSGGIYLTDIKSARFQFQLEAS